MNKEKPFFSYNSSPKRSKNFGKILGECDDTGKLHKISDCLWTLLDDIDTASDIFRPSNEEGYRKFYNYTMKKVKERHKSLESDGYNLFIPITRQTSQK